MSSAPKAYDNAAAGGSTTAMSYEIPTQVRSAFPTLSEQDWSVVQRICAEQNVAPQQMLGTMLHNILQGNDLGFTIPKGG